MPSPAVFVSGTAQDLGGNGNAAQIVFTLVWDPLESTCRHASLSIL